MTKFSPCLLLILLSLFLLDGCGNSRVVRRDSTNQRTAASQPMPQGKIYLVKSGDTLYRIATRFGLQFKELALWNQIPEPYTIQVGQQLRLGPSQNTSISKRSKSKVATQSVAASTHLVADPTDSIVSAGPPWHWPTNGPIIGRYVVGDQTQQGINIAGKSGQAITAAADGLVVYSGAGLVGYGELIIIKHSDQWLSAYAHNRRRLVAEGVQVKSGDAIAEMGRTGAVRDMLHFEIRRNGKPVDPLSYLPKQ